MKRALLVAAVAVLGMAAKKPHIVLMVADDYGWNEVGYNQNKRSSANPQGKPTTNGIIPTPALDALAAESVKLQNYYVQPVCSPTRGTIMTGRYPSHTGIGPDVIYPTHPYGMPKEETLLPELLKDSGYATYMVGKWHLGLCDERYTPQFRGFDSFYGYLLGAEDYFSHNRNGALDLRNGTGAGSLGAADTTEEGRYSTELFASEAERLVRAHDPDTPMFLYFAQQAVHSPLEAPEEYKQRVEGAIPHTTKAGQERWTKAAMVAAMDDSVANLTKALKANGMWEDTVFVFTTDNGAPIVSQGNNYPLRGHKATTWEGGVRGVGFVRGTDSALAPLPKGVDTMELMHSSDWLPTLVRGLVGGNTSRTRPLDGHDQWQVLEGKANTTRTKVVHNMPAAGQGLSGGAIRVGRHKLLVQGMQTTIDEKQTPPPEMPQPAGDVIPPAYDYNGTKVYVFDVISDPTESHNLASINSSLLDALVSEYLIYQRTAVPDLSLRYGIDDPASNPKLRPDDTWGPFVNSQYCKW